ncbi:MAG: NAD-glutamate dehydrogenase, partial [Marinomonas gallaica]
IAAHVTNNVGNRMGSTFSTYVQEETSASALNVLRAYMAAEQMFDIPALWDAINELDFKVDNSLQNQLFIQIQSLLEKATLWLIRNTREALAIQKLTDTYKPGIGIIRSNLDAILTQPTCEYISDVSKQLQEQNVPAEIADRLSALPFLFYGLDIIRVAAQTEKEVLDTAQTYFALEMDLGLYWLRQSINQLPADDMWERRAKAGLGDEVDNALRTISQEVIQASIEVNDLDSRLANWKELNHDNIHHYHSTFGEIKSEPELSLSMVSVAIRELRNLI